MNVYFSIFLFLSSSISILNAFELKEFLRIKIPDNYLFVKTNFGPSINCRNDGSFICGQEGYPNPWAVVVNRKNKYYFFKPNNWVADFRTNQIDSGTANGILYVVNQEIQNYTGSRINTQYMIRLIGDDSVIFFESAGGEMKTNIVKITNSKRTLISSTNESKNQNYIKKSDYDGQIIQTQLLKNGFIGNGISSESHSNQFLILAEIDDNYIVFNRLTDSEVIDASRIVLDSENNQDIKLNLFNTTGNYLRVQSSTNLINWSTFKTIKNEQSLEIVVPANQKQEFIRAIE